MALLWAASSSVAADEPGFLYRAPITVTQTAAFVALPLPASAYAHCLQDDLADLQVVDALGARVPFALLPPRTDAQQVEQTRSVAMFALPPGRAGAALASPIELTVRGETISVKRLGGSTLAGAVPGSPGWLFDLGERHAGDPAPQWLRLDWAGPAAFSASFELQTSADLRHWQPAGAGQLMALASAAGPLVQNRVELPPGVARFLRLVWVDGASAPALRGAQALVDQARQVALDAPTLLQLAPTAPAASADAAHGAQVFDLGGVLPVGRIELQFPPGNHVAPLRVQGRRRAGEPWHELAFAVFYQIERGALVSRSPPLALNATLRYLRLEPDERAPALDGTALRLQVQAALPSLVFANQGQAPFFLRAGSPQARPGALPVASLVPALEDERARFGQATLGTWAESPEVAQAIQAARRRAALRPWLLWSVLLSGVGGLGWMVWQLARAPQPSDASGKPPEG